MYQLRYSPPGWIVLGSRLPDGEYAGLAWGSTVVEVNVLVVDLAAVQCRLVDDHVEVSVPSLGVVASVPAACPVDPALGDRPASLPSDGLWRREAVFRALDAALEHGRVPVARSWARLAFYNPLSAEVAVDPVPRTIAFRSDCPLVLPPEGALGVLADGVLRVAGRELYPRPDEFSQVQQAISAHLV